MKFRPKRRVFNNTNVQAVYDHLIAADPDETIRSRGSTGNAYWTGRFRPDPDRPQGRRGSATYAAWAAGIDRWWREGGKVEFWDDERNLGNGILVTLKPGWAFSDVITDPQFDGVACHVQGFDTVAEATRAVGQAPKCCCRECRS